MSSACIFGMNEPQSLCDTLSIFGMNETSFGRPMRYLNHFFMIMITIIIKRKPAVTTPHGSRPLSGISGTAFALHAQYRRFEPALETFCFVVVWDKQTSRSLSLDAQTSMSHRLCSRGQRVGHLVSSSIFFVKFSYKTHFQDPNGLLSTKKLLKHRHMGLYARGNVRQTDNKHKYIRT